MRVNPPTGAPQPLQDGSRQINTIPLPPLLQSPSQTCPGAFCTVPQRVPEGLSPTARGRDHSGTHSVFTGFPVFPPWESLSQLNHLHTGLCQALLSAEAPIRALPGPSTRGAGDLLSSYFSFPRTPGFCSDLLFAGFRSHRFSPGGHTTLVYPITINSQQSSLVSNHTNKSCLGQTAILSEWILGSGGGWDTLQASSQARNSVFTLGHVS